MNVIERDSDNYESDIHDSDKNSGIINEHNSDFQTEIQMVI